MENLPLAVVPSSQLYVSVSEDEGLSTKTAVFLYPHGFALAPLLSAADLSLPVEVAGQGTSISISLSIAPETEALSGLQFDLQYDSSVMSVVATGDAPRAAAKSVYFDDLAPGQRRFLCIGLNQNLMPARSSIS